MVGDIDLGGNSGLPGSGGDSQSVIAIGSGDHSFLSLLGREGKNLIAGPAKLE